jgi:hypothetical protein
MRNFVKIALFAVFCATSTACLTTEDELETPDVTERDLAAEPGTSSADECDELAPETDDPEQAAACCIEGTAFCPVAPFTEFDYVCASRVIALQRCNAACPVACQRQEFNIC